MGPPEIADQLDTTLEVLEGWAAAYPEIADALVHSRARERAWWDKFGREGMKDRAGFNATAYKHIMEARFGGFGWGPKPARLEHTGKDGGAIEYRNLSEAELDQRLRDSIAGRPASAAGRDETAPPTVN